MQVGFGMGGCGKAGDPEGLAGLGYEWWASPALINTSGNRVFKSRARFQPQIRGLNRNSFE
jgi:hypothetical protein